MYGNLDHFLDNLLGAPASRCSPSLRCAARYSRSRYAPLRCPSGFARPLRVWPCGPPLHIAGAEEKKYPVVTVVTAQPFLATVSLLHKPTPLLILKTYHYETEHG